MTAAATASPKLAKIPAAETNNSPLLILEKFKGFIGTGLAQPKRMGEPVKINKAGSRIVPKRSICGIGFKVSLPARCAVVSPNLRATTPCMTSWTITENNKTIIDKAKNSGI